MSNNFFSKSFVVYNLMDFEEKKWCARSEKRDKVTRNQYIHQTSRY